MDGLRDDLTPCCVQCAVAFSLAVCAVVGWVVHWGAFVFASSIPLMITAFWEWFWGFAVWSTHTPLLDPLPPPSTHTRSAFMPPLYGPFGAPVTGGKVRSRKCAHTAPP